MDVQFPIPDVYLKARRHKTPTLTSFFFTLIGVPNIDPPPSIYIYYPLKLMKKVVKPVNSGYGLESE
jgi:hypothetical protein